MADASGGGGVADFVSGCGAAGVGEGMAGGAGAFRSARPGIGVRWGGGTGSVGGSGAVCGVDGCEGGVLRNLPGFWIRF